MQQQADARKPLHVVVAVPTMGSVHPRLTALLLHWARSYSSDQLSFFMTQMVYPHDRARNRIVQHFLGVSQATHVLMIDSDMVPPVEAIERLMSHGKPFVTGLTPLPKTDLTTGATRVVDFAFAPAASDREPMISVARNSGLKEIARCGAGCLLLSRELLDGLQPPWFRFVMNETGTELTASEDVDFCDRLRAAGITLYADTSVVCQHEKSMTL